MLSRVACNNNNNNNNNYIMTQTEKPYHYTYLKGFRVEQCAQFLQHKCTNHKPFTCFDWHFQNQRRRRPTKKADGNFNYSPDTYCTKYDETTGICPDKDECPFLHRTAGDTERRYHLRYYKTGICVHDTDARGHCVKNGQHCAFAHGAHDLRNPVYDIRELQASEANGVGGMSCGGGSSVTADSLDGGTGNAQSSCALLLNSGPNSLDRERNALNEDPRWNETAYVLANYKTDICKRPPRLCRQGYACPQYHNSKDRRRTPKTFKYRSTPCPSVKQGDEWGDPVNCEQGESCPYCHTRTEQQFHPEIYKSTKCNDMQQSGYCPRGPFCAFAHDEKEITATRDINLDLIDTDTTPASVAGSTASTSSLLTSSNHNHHHHKLQQQQQHQSQLNRAALDCVEFGDLNPSSLESRVAVAEQQNHTLPPGPIARPRSLSQSQARVGGDYNLHAALAAVRLSMREDVGQTNSQNEGPSGDTGTGPFGLDIWKRELDEALADRRATLLAERQQHNDAITMAALRNKEALVNGAPFMNPMTSQQSQQHSVFGAGGAGDSVMSDTARLLNPHVGPAGSHHVPESRDALSSSLNHSLPGPIARPRSYSQSQTRAVDSDYNLHAALAAVRLGMRDDPQMSSASVSSPTPGNATTTTTTSAGTMADNVVPSAANSSPFGLDLWKRDSDALDRRAKLVERQRANEAMSMASAMCAELKSNAPGMCVNGSPPYLHAIHSFSELDNVPVNQLLQLRQQLRMDLELLDKLIQRKDHNTWA